MKITVSLDEARELAGAVTGPLRELLLAAIVDHTEDYFQGTCVHCHREVSSDRTYPVWTSQYGRDVCKLRELGSDGEYQRHQVRGYATMTRERYKGPGFARISLEGRGRDRGGAIRLDTGDEDENPVIIWSQEVPCTRGATWQEWFTPDFEILVSGLMVSVDPDE